MSGSTIQIRVVREHDLGVFKEFYCFLRVFTFFLEDLSYRFLTRFVSKRDFVLDFGGRLSGVPARARARARAPDQCSRSAIMQEFCSRLSGSTIQVVREHNLALPARLSGSTTQVVREHGSDSCCLGARFRFVRHSNAFCALFKFFLEDLSYRFLTVPGGKCDFAWISALGCRGFPRARARARVLPSWLSGSTI